MRALAEYIVSVSAAALLCGILNSIMVKGTAREILKLVSGLFLAFSVISPVSNLRLPELTEIEATWQTEAADAVHAGEIMARDAVSDSISEQLETYILDKAESMGLDLTVHVSLKMDDSCLPETVTMEGRASAEERQQLTVEITEALGLTEEDIKWIQQP